MGAKIKGQNAAAHLLREPFVPVCSSHAVCLAVGLIACLSLCVILSLCASAARADQPASRQHATFIEMIFPGQQDFGRIYALPIGFDLHQARRAPRRLVGAAQGVVRLSRHWPLLFAPNDAISERSEVFSHLPDDAFVILDLEKLSLGDKEIETIVHMKSLLILLMEGSEIGDAGLAKLGALPNLLKIDVYGTNVTGATIRDLKSLSNLHCLRLGCNKLNLTCIDDICRITKLTSLNLDRVKLTDKDMLKISQLPQLHILEVPNNPAVTSVGLGYVKKMPSLKIVDLRGCSIKAADLIALKVSKLESVTILPESYSAAELVAIRKALKGMQVCTTSRTEIMSPELFAPLK